MKDRRGLILGGLILIHFIFNDIYVEPNMFYISFSYPTTQPVFHEIAVHFSIVTEIIVYLSVISLFSYLFYLLEYRFLFIPQSKSPQS